MITTTNNAVLINFVLSNMTNTGYDSWHVNALGGMFGSISKSDGLYFAHYTNRNTALTGHTHFMKAVAEILKAYKRFMEHYEEKFINQPTFMKSGNFHVIFGTDKRMYVKHTSTLEYRAISHVDIYNFATELGRAFPAMGESDKVLLPFIRELFMKISKRNACTY